MKSLPKFTLVVITVVAAGYWLTGTTLLGFQAASGVRRGSPNRAEPADSKSASDAKLFATKERPADAPGPELPEAKAVLDQARQRLLSYQSIKAKLVESVALPNRRFTVQGSYLQDQGDYLKLRLEFQVKLDDTEGSLLEVCDGQVLWTRFHIGNEVRISRRDVRQILQAAAEDGLADNLITVELGFGGLPGLLASIEKSMQFDQLKEDTADGRKLVVIEGGWTRDMLNLWKANRPNAPLPEYVPQRIRLYFDGESLFPRRILYLSRSAAEPRLRPMVSLDFSEVETDVAIPPAKFKFVPPEGVFPQDLTPQFLDQIKQRRQVGGK